MTCIILNDFFCQFKKGCCQSQAKVYMHEVLVNLSVKLARKKSEVYRGTDPLDMTLAVDWDVKNKYCMKI